MWILWDFPDDEVALGMAVPLESAACSLSLSGGQPSSSLRSNPPWLSGPSSGTASIVVEDARLRSCLLCCPPALPRGQLLPRLAHVILGKTFTHKIHPTPDRPVLRVTDRLWWINPQRSGSFLPGALGLNSSARFVPCSEHEET